MKMDKILQICMIDESETKFNFKYERDMDLMRRFSYEFSLIEEKFLLNTTPGIEIDFVTKTVWKTCYGTRNHVLPSVWKNAWMSKLVGQTKGHDVLWKFV